MLHTSYVHTASAQLLTPRHLLCTPPPPLDLLALILTLPLTLTLTPHPHPHPHPKQMLAQLDLDATRIFYADFQHMMTNPSRYGQIGRHLRLRTQRLSKKALTMGSINLEGIIQEPSSSTQSRLPPRREATEPKRLVAEPRDRLSDSSSSASQSLRRSG